jgi:hypothetical protein
MSWDVVENRTSPTLVAPAPLCRTSPARKSCRKDVMNLQLLHVELRPYLNCGSVSQILPDPSTTNTRSTGLDEQLAI